MKHLYTRYLKRYIPKSWFALYHHGLRRWLFWLKRRSMAVNPWSRAADNPLRQYFLNNTGRLIHKCDHYFDIYHRHFARFRGRPVRILEIGVYHGGSLQMWKDYFGPQAEIVGLDIEPRTRVFDEPGVEIVVGSQEDREFLRTFCERYRAFDIIIDDGGHTMNQQIVSFEELYGLVKEDGIYLAEDLCTSYWPEYGGGHRAPQSFIEYSKQLIDRLHAWHSREDDLPVDDFTKSADSLHFYDSILVIEKGKHSQPVSHMTGTPSFPE